jgi:hypothetical protein
MRSAPSPAAAMPGTGRCRICWLPDPDDVQDGQVPGEPVDHVDDGQLSDGGGSDILAFRVAFLGKFSVLKVRGFSGAIAPMRLCALVGLLASTWPG